MDDTQWPRYQVFKQDRPDLPFENVGSVHAPDIEIALQNARDVFVRRPDCSGLWVVPAEAILSVSSRVMANDGSESRPVSEPVERFFVFVKSNHSGTHEYRGAVEASTLAQALSIARASLDAPAHPGIVWWVFPARAVLQNEPQDAESMFDPARHKPYRHPAYYRTDSMMRAIKDKRRRERGGLA